MKRILAIVTAVMLVCMLAGCGVGPKEASPDLAGGNAVSGEEKAPDGKEDSSNASGSGGSGSTGKADFNNWPDLFKEYQVRFLDNTTAFSEDEETGLLMLTLLAGDIDLAFTNAFFGPDAETGTAMAFEMFGGENITYSESGDTAVVEADFDGTREKYEVQYAGGNTAVMKQYMDGELISELSLCVTDEYAAKMYKCYTPDAEQTVCAIVNPKGDIWLGVDQTVLDGTLYQNAAAAADTTFATSLPESHTYIDGKYTGG